MRAMFAAWACLVALLLLAFVDAPFLTFGQKFRHERRHERLVLMSIELNLFLLWAMGMYFFGLDRRLAPTEAAAALASAGLVVTALGVLLAASGKIRLGRWFSATFAVKEAHRLITAWPYSWVRHPIYTGLVIAVAGSGLVWNSALTLLLAALLVIPFWFHTVFEELLFERHFGDEFRAYRARVPRLVPFYGSRTKRDSRVP
jgi:protein-S-isoprenylcysteine O-methyltransferase Ste14